jgi:hypothetical protein
MAPTSRANHIERVVDTSMADPSPSTSAIDAVLAALERLAGDLRHRAEEAEGRAAAADERAALERQAREAEAEARHGAEARAAVAEQSARDAIRRAEAAEAAARESAERLRRELLAAVQKAVEAAEAAAQAAARLDRRSAERLEDPFRSERDPELSHIPEPMAGRRSSSSQPAPRRWAKGSGYAWIEDDPGPPWWRRMLKLRRRY